jgi:hypothetical protein
VRCLREYGRDFGGFFGVTKGCGGDAGQSKSALLSPVSPVFRGRLRKLVYTSATLVLLVLLPLWLGGSGRNFSFIGPEAVT